MGARAAGVTEFCAYSEAGALIQMLNPIDNAVRLQVFIKYSLICEFL
jgi:hypothetical protein